MLVDSYASRECIFSSLHKYFKFRLYAQVTSDFTTYRITEYLTLEASEAITKPVPSVHCKAWLTQTSNITFFSYNTLGITGASVD